MTLPVPHSTVNDSNYGTLGNQLKGESHASRMSRVNAMRRMEVGPTLQPLGSVGEWSEQIGGPLALSAVTGMILGASNKGSLFGAKSKARGIFGMTAAVVLGTGIGVLSTGLHPGFEHSELEDWGQAVGVGLVSGLAAGLGHGFTRSTGHWARA